jgi:ribonuclease HI
MTMAEKPLAQPAPGEELREVTIHSDGACEGNPGPGGWAAVLQHGEHKKEISGGEIATTNNRMELIGALQGLSALKERCRVTFYTDSEYLRNGITEWIHSWKRRGWKTGTKAIKNVDLWKPLDEVAARHVVTWKWVKGHSGNALNERCDVLAVAEIAKIRKAHTKRELADAKAKFVEERDGKEGTVQTKPLPLG